MTMPPASSERPSIQRGRTCPICGTRLAFDHSYSNCPDCGAILGNIFAASTTVKRRQLAPRTRKEWLELFGEIGSRSGLATLAGGLAAAVLVFVLTPIFGGSNRVWLLAAGYIGGQIGFFMGLLWTLLRFVERYITWGLAAGIVAGALSGVMNFYLMNIGGYLPEVKIWEHCLIGVLAGAACGVFIGVYRGKEEG